MALLATNLIAGERRKRASAPPAAGRVDQTAHATEVDPQRRNEQATEQDQSIARGARDSTDSEFQHSGVPRSTCQVLLSNGSIPTQPNVSSTYISDSSAHATRLQPPSNAQTVDLSLNIEDAASLNGFATFPLLDYQLNPSTSANSFGDLSTDYSSQWVSGHYDWQRMAQRASVPVNHVDVTAANYLLDAERTPAEYPRGGPPIFSAHEHPSDNATPIPLAVAPLSKVVPTSRSIASALPDPYRNHIRVNRYSLYIACHENAALLGVIKPLAKTVGFKSPFHQVDLSGELALRTIQTHFGSISTDLRPCVAQLVHEHEFYIDVFPFTKFRERAISLLALSPPAFDEMELRNDLDSDGLICWGGAFGLGSGRPWDMRSWEAQPWFLNKWWMLTRGSGLEEQSSWWRAMRGEEGGQLGDGMAGDS